MCLKIHASYQQRSRSDFNGYSADHRIHLNRKICSLRLCVPSIRHKEESIFVQRAINVAYILYQTIPSAILYPQNT